MRRAALLLVLLAVLVASLAAPAVASPQPRPICGPCGGGLERAAVGSDVGELDVTGSTADVRIHEDGSATWRVTVSVGNETAAAYLAEHPAVLEEVVEESLEYTATGADFRNVSARIDDGTVRATFEDPEGARRMAGGVMVNEYFHSRGYDDWTVVTADRVTVVGPPGTTVTNDPAGAEVDGRNATWRGDPTARLSRAPRVEADAYVAFADGGGADVLRTQVAIAMLTAPIVWDVVSTFYLPPLLAFLLLLALALGAVRRGLAGRDVPVVRTSLAVAGLGGLLLVGPLVVDVPTVLGGVPLLPGVGAVYLATGAAGYWRGGRGEEWTLLLAGTLAALAAVVALALLAPDGRGASATLTRGHAGAVAGLLPLATATVLGAAAVRDQRRRLALAVAATVGAVLAFQLSIAWPTERPFGLVLLVFFGYVLAVTAAMVPGYLLGATVASAHGDDGNDGDGASPAEPVGG